MSKDQLSDNVDVLLEHPNRMKKIVDMILEVIESARLEEYELYTMTVQQQKNCNIRLEEVSELYRQSKLNYSYSGNDAMSEYLTDWESAKSDTQEQKYKDAAESDLYNEELKFKYNELNDKLQRLNQNLAMLDNIGEYIVFVKNTSNDLLSLFEYYNNKYTAIINELINLK